MKKYFSFLALILLSFYCSQISSATAADGWIFWEVQPWELAMTVTPVRYELNGNRGATITRPITIFNYSKFSVDLAVSFENFLSEWTSGTPTLIPNSEIEIPEAHIASWMSINTPNFTLASGESREVFVTIQIPTNATPGGHYGATLFNYTVWGVGTNLGTARRIGVLVLLNVAGEVVVDGNVPLIEVRWGDGGWAGASSKNNTLWKSFTTFVLSALKKVKQTALWEKDTSTDTSSWSTVDSWTGGTESTGTDTWTWSTDVSQNKDTPDPIDISITFENDGNTHIKPTGKIIITDENGEELKWIWKKIIKNDADAFIGEQVVDYLPINDQWGNVLPWTKRVFDVTWEWFPYETINEKWEKVVKYKTLWDYYTELNMKGRSEYELRFWEQLKTRIKKKNLTANITVVHKDKDGKDVEFNSAKDIKVSYTESYIWLNVPVVTVMWIAGSIILLALLKWLGGWATKSAIKIPVSTTVNVPKKQIVWAKKEKTYYDILQVKKSATKKEIEAAYKSLIKKEGSSKEIEKAYKTLSDKEKKSEYDKKIKRPL